MADGRARASADLDAFAAAVAHEIRTPLSAVAGEVEIALRRDRTAADYRDALHRIAAGIAELVEISGDLTLLNEARNDGRDLPATTFESVMARVRPRYAARNDIAIADAPPAEIPIAGDPDRIARAIALVLDHALRHRKGPSSVSVEGEATPGGVRLVVTAPPSGFWPRAWRTLSESADDPAAPLRLRTARRILQCCDGAVRLAVSQDPAADAVHVELHQRR